MPFIDHEHRHEWYRVGCVSRKAGVHEVYRCRGCSAWSYLELKDTARVPFSRGQLSDDTEHE